MAETSRDLFASRLGMLAATLGSSVGLGNIWKFPALTGEHGGASFLLVYILSTLVVGLPLMIAELLIGRSTRSNAYQAFKTLSSNRFWWIIGGLGIAGAVTILSFYSDVAGWVFAYIPKALTGSVHTQDPAVAKEAFSSLLACPWKSLFWQWLVLGLTASVILRGASGGIEKANKVMMPILFFLFVALGIYVFTLPGASGGYRYIFTIKPEGLLDPYVWIYAFGQAFFSLSVAGNGSVIYGSYLSKNECIPSSARNVALFDTIAALLAAFVIIPAMAAGGAELDAGGPGLMFIYLVHVMNGMAGGRIVAMVFFLCVSFAGVTSIINLYEAPVASLQEKLGLKRVPATAVIHVIGLAAALCIQAIVSQWMDVVSIYICPLGALLAAVMFFWIGGKKLVLESVNLGARKPIGGWYYPAGKYVYCASVLVALIAGAILGGIG